MRTDPDTTKITWRANDRVTGLRVVGAERTATRDNLDLTSAPSELLIGFGETSTWRLANPRVSRQHVSLTLADGVWMLRDLNSTNGTKQNGVPRPMCVLAPGDCIELGDRDGVRLIAESAVTIEVHEFLQRLLGWSTDKLATVDEGLFSVRDLARMTTPLLVRGDGSLRGVIKRLHALALGHAYPLVFRERGETGNAAIARARNGVLCLEADAMPADAPIVATALRIPAFRARLVTCAPIEKLGPTPNRKLPDLYHEFASRLLSRNVLEIPQLTERRDEFPKLLEAYGWDAVQQLGADRLAMHPNDPEWLWASGAINDFETLQQDALYLVAVRRWGVSEGARRVGIAAQTLSKWTQRRGIPSTRGGP